MGVRSTGNHPTTTQADGHLLEYFRQTFGAGGAGFTSGKNGNDPEGLFASSDGGIGTGGGGGGDARSVPIGNAGAGHGGPGIVAISYTIII